MEKLCVCAVSSAVCTCSALRHSAVHCPWRQKAPLGPYTVLYLLEKGEEIVYGSRPGLVSHRFVPGRKSVHLRCKRMQPRRLDLACTATHCIVTRCTTPSRREEHLGQVGVGMQTGQGVSSLEQGLQKGRFVEAARTVSIFTPTRLGEEVVEHLLKVGGTLWRSDMWIESRILRSRLVPNLLPT